MDKYEYSIKSDKIKKLVESKDYETAVKIADTIDWERVRNMKMLSTVSLAYEKMSRFEEAKDLLLMAYECAPVGRRFLYKLTELAVKQGSYDEAEDYLKEFAATSPQDPSRLVLRYEISKAKGEPTERLITILEAYQKREFEERWSYELAALYYKVGKNEDCVKLCDEIVLWFGVGPYVDKAMELKQRIAPLTPDQIEKRENKEKYQRRLEEVQREFEEKYRVIEEPSKEAVEKALQASQAAVAAVEVPEEDPVDEEPVAAEEVVAEEIPEEDALEDITPDELPAAELTEQEEPEIVETVEEVSAETVDTVAAAAALEAEVEANLAREIETASLKAALNAVMLKETVATMETIGAVENDHSHEREQTKVAAPCPIELAKTKEFVRQAAAIRMALSEVQDHPVTVAEVEVKLEAMAVEEVVEEAPVEEIPAAEEVAEETLVEEVPVVEKTPAAEEPAAEVAVEEAPAEEIPAVEEVVEEAPVEEIPVAEEVAEETPVEEVPVVEETPAAEESVEEAPAEEIPAVEEVVEEAPAEEIPAVEEVVEEAPAEEIPAVEEIPAEAAPAQNPVRDHYVLVMGEDEDAAVKECVAYIRRMRELLGYPVTQVAKIKGAKLAVKDMAQTLHKLQGRDLVVCGISQLPDAMLAETIDLMASDNIKSFIALIDKEQEIAALQERMAFFADCRVIGHIEEIPVVVPVETPEQKSEPVVLQEETPATETMPPVEIEVQAPVETKEVSVAVEETPAKKEKDSLEELVEEALRAGVMQLMANEEKEDLAEEPEFVEKQAEEAAGSHELTPKAFYECAIRHAEMMDAIVDEMGGLAIYAVAEEYQQEREPLTEELAQELIENAVVRAERRTIKSLFSNRYNKEGYLILKEQHIRE